MQQIYEAFKIALASIAAHKLRSSLTLLGVVIGVMTIISTMSVIKGLQTLIEEEMSQLSAGVFQVQRYDANVNFGNHRRRHEYRPKLGMREVQAIREHVDEAMIVAPEVWEWGNTVKFENETTPPSIVMCGGTPGTAANNGWAVAEGRWLTDQDVQFGRRVAVIGDYVARRLFPYRSPLGQEISINGDRATVVGVFEKRGSTFNQNADHIVSIPLTTYTNWLGTEDSWNITVQVRDPSQMDKAIEETIAAMRGARGLKPGEENNFGIWHSDQLVETFDQMTAFIRYAAFGIASISLLVAGIGIMNIMLVTVTERTREIGVRMALGAKRRSVLSQFLLEAVFLTEIGAAVGVMVGIGAALLLKSSAGLSIVIPGWTIFLAILFCSLIGLVFGTWPAYKASRLDPIEALRYE
ncbi:FtsX-like permease family protein [bacterium]|nr:FtsX-like permease family protein [bacterium]